MLQNFITTTYHQVSKVKSFYEEKLNEISQRMEVLVDSVDTSGLNLNTRQHQRSRSLIESITQKWGSMIHGNGLRPVRDREHYNAPGTGMPDLAKIFSESMDDDDETQKREKKEELLRKEDSIKRAITDIYRTAKLLHNYSIMVSYRYLQTSCWIYSISATIIVRCFLTTLIARIIQDL